MEGALSSRYNGIQSMRISSGFSGRVRGKDVQFTRIRTSVFQGPRATRCRRWCQVFSMSSQLITISCSMEYFKVKIASGTGKTM